MVLELLQATLHHLEYVVCSKETVGRVRAVFDLVGVVNKEDDIYNYQEEKMRERKISSCQSKRSCV